MKLEKGAYYRFYNEDEWDVVPLCYGCVDYYYDTHTWEGYEWWEDLGFDHQDCAVCGNKLYE